LNSVLSQRSVRLSSFLSLKVARKRPNTTPVFFFLLGVAISLFLGFHNNASYDRWWEARKLWGKQIIVTRDLARFLAGVMDVDDGTVYDPLDKNNEFKSSRTAVTKVPSTDTSVSDNDVSADLETNRVSTNWNGIIQSMNVSPKHTDPKAYKYASWQVRLLIVAQLDID